MKSKEFCTAKRINKVNKQSTEQDRMFPNKKFDKELILKAQTAKSTKISRQKTQTLLSKEKKTYKCQKAYEKKFNVIN